MMRQCRHRRHRSTLLPTSLCTSSDGQSRILAMEATRRPLLPGRVPQGLPLRREIAEAGWNAKEEGIVLFEGCGVDGWV
jgi:hypothetical protein